MPLLAGALDVMAGIVAETGKTKNVSIQDIVKVMDGDRLMDAVIHLGGLEFTDLIRITWALAKSADEDIPEPREWVKGFDEFPVDIIAPAVFGMIAKGVISSKNLTRLEEMRKGLQPGMEK